MCTIAALRAVHPHYPLLVVANRDEVLSRPSTPPVLHDSALGIVGGRDLEKGGTWLAVRRDGLFCGLTNQRPERPPNPHARSRGEVVLAVLRSEGPHAAAALVRGLEPRVYNGFNLLFGDATTLFTASVWPWLAAPEVAEVAAGVHVLPTSRLDAEDYPKVSRLRTALSHPDVPREDWPALRIRFRAALADHTVPAPEALPPVPPGTPFDRRTLAALDAVCIHLPTYGTRSSTLLALAPGAVLHAEHAEGPPCRTPFEPFGSFSGGERP
jgi:uncharacterized protein with NRDE domain